MVLAFTTVLSDAVLHSFSSESLQNQQVDLHDNLTTPTSNLSFPAEGSSSFIAAFPMTPFSRLTGLQERRQSRLLTALSNSRLGILIWSEASNNTSGPAELIRRMPQGAVEINFCVLSIESSGPRRANLDASACADLPLEGRQATILGSKRRPRWQTFGH